MNIIFEDDASHIPQCNIFLFICSCYIKQVVLNESKNIINTYLSHEKFCTCQKGHDEFRFKLCINSDSKFFGFIWQCLSKFPLFATMSTAEI